MKNIKSLILVAFIIICSTIMVSCSKYTDLPEVKSGQMVFIPFSDNYAVGTDSTIVIMNRTTGKTVNIIKRK